MPMRHVAEALVATQNWPFRTAVLTGPPRSGKSLLARWFANSSPDDGGEKPSTMRNSWTKTSCSTAGTARRKMARALLIVGGEPPWDIALPDLRSRLGRSLQLEIGQPDDDMARDLMLSLAEERGLPLRDDAADYLVPRASRISG